MPTYLRKQPIPNQYLKQQEAIDFVRGKGRVDLGVVHFNPTFKDPPPKQDFGFLKRDIPLGISLFLYSYNAFSIVA